ncbi:MAG: hypothetical protein AAGG02_09765 [Cyanobacteria bacterium P01_H01_bin.15]
MIFKNILGLFTQGSKDYRLQHELMTMLHNDQGAANRLLNLEHRKHPGKTEQWYIEKVIYDLQRDR